MTDFITVSEAARELEAQFGLSIPPRAISDSFYQRRLPESLGPIVGGRRLINRDALPQIAEILCQERDNKSEENKVNEGDEEAS